MRVAFTSPALFGARGVFGGGERYAERLARAVADLVGGATLYAAGPRDEEWSEGPLRYVVRRPLAFVRGQRSNPLPRGVLRALRGADVVHCFQWHIALTSAALLAARLRRTPAFVTDLGGGGWDVSAYLDTSRLAAAFLHLSRYAQEVAGRGGCAPDRVLYGGCGRPPSATGDERREVLIVGRLLPHKGADVLVEAAEPDWPVTVVGAPAEGAFGADLRRLAAGKRVAFRGALDDEGLEAAYSRAAVVVVPSLYRDRYGRETAVPELLGLTAIEASARGVPVVASRVASLPEVVADGVTGRLVPPGDAAALRRAVGSLLSDREERRRLGEAARARAREVFSWERAADVAAGAYEQALGGRV